MPTEETQRLQRKGLLAYTNGTSQATNFGGDADLKPDFSTRLLKILAGFKKDGELNDAKSADTQFVKGNLQEVNMQGLPQSEDFTGHQLQNRLARDLKRQAKSLCGTPDCGEGFSPNKNELDSYLQSDEHFWDSPQIKEEVTQFNHLHLEETDFSSESDDDCQSEENRQALHEQGMFALNCSTQPFEVQKAIQSEFSPPPVNKQQGFISPRHLSRSSGSRSNPSRSSIPGLRSKYSKPDPKAKQLKEPAKPLCLLPKFEVMAQASDKSLLHPDDLNSNGLSDVLEDITVCNRSLSKRSNHGMSNGFEDSSEQTIKQPKDSIDFEWSDSEEEMDVRAEDCQLFEWSDSDEDNTGQNVPHTRDENGKKKGVLSFDTKHSVQQLTLPRKGLRTKTTAIRPLTWYNREECEKLGSITYVDSKLLHQPPATVKFLEVPPWKSQKFPHLPFEFQYSYSEIPKAPILGFRDHYSPFGPKTMERPWTGRPLPKPRNLLRDNIPSSYSVVQRLKSFEFSFNRKGVPPSRVMSREEVLGQPLTDYEVKRLVKNCHIEKRQVNLGRDGLTHNMLHLIHTHWKSRPVCRIKCRGAPTLDMDNVCFHIEDKTGGQIIYRTGCVLYVFRGRHYSYNHRPVLPLMLYRPSSPVYPKLVPQAPAGLTIEEARQLRILGQKVKPLIKLRKNGAFPDLVKVVRDAFMVDDLVSLEYDDLKAGDYRKIGAKLKELVPCVLLSFRNQRIVLWKGKDSNPSSTHISESRVKETRLIAAPSEQLIDAEGSFIKASEPKSVDLTVEAADVCIQKGEDTLVESEEENIELQPNSEQHVQTKIEAHGAAWDRVLPEDEPKTSSMLEDIWDMALKDGIAVELEGVDLEADLVLQVTSVFSEVAPSGPEYTNRVVNKLRLQGVYEKSSKEFSVRFNRKRKTLPRLQRSQKQASRPLKVKRHPDILHSRAAVPVGIPHDAIEKPNRHGTDGKQSKLDSVPNRFTKTKFAELGCLIGVAMVLMNRESRMSLLGVHGFPFRIHPLHGSLYGVLQASSFMSLIVFRELVKEWDLFLGARSTFSLTQ
ncbi:hypothetical protein GOP47_0003167 [Adiantum capillus-veneris]|uniref:CRM domain-containing protein n=1 Tax=Adiantum capillus-veneris TaxID=13818 RepID=A0A9D4ZPU5_ADICA|nr:hypothetical protein GOP47_0003167 [Adiantum capillus-veneris]